MIKRYTNLHIITTEVGLGPHDTVLDGEPAPLPQKGAEPPPIFTAHVYCGQTAVLIKMALVMKVGLGSSPIVLAGDPALLPQNPPPIFGSFLLWSNGWMHQDATGYGGRRQPRRLCVRWRPRPLLIYGRCLLWPNGCIDQDATWYGSRPRPTEHCVRWGPSSPLPKRGPSPLPNFRSMFIVAKRLGASRCHLVWR